MTLTMEELNLLNILRKDFNTTINEQTSKYQKKYGFAYNPENPNHSTHNNEADAFKHAFMQAYLVIHYNKAISKLLGDFHEDLEGKDSPRSEYYMDKHNNIIGRQIGEEVKKEFKEKSLHQFIKKDTSYDTIAEKIIQKMNEGKLILKPGDKPSKPRKQYPTGLASNIETPRLSSAERLKQRLESEWAAKTQSKKDASEKFENTKSLENYINKVSNSNKIYTQEEISSFSKKEYEEHKKAVDYQRKTIGIPTERQAKKRTESGGMVHVSAYVRSDGVRVESYYRSAPSR